MNKKTLVIFVIGIAISFTACSSKPVVEANKTAENLPVIENHQDEPGIGKQNTLETIAREQAGLSTLPITDISNIEMNHRLTQLLQEDKYLDNDYLSGIVRCRSGWLINKRFTQDIIGNIRIGSSIAGVKQLLGTPTVTEKEYLFYKTNKLYIGFHGTDKVEAVVLGNIPKSYDKNILHKLITELCTEDATNIFDLIQSDEEVRLFFDANGHIHGGGWYAESANGIVVEDFDGLNIIVYNNFEGELFQPGDFITYDNSDYMINSLIGDFNSYYGTERAFLEEGQLSPSGKYNSIYEWIHSQSHYFTIRTMDNTKPDFVIGAPACNYRWLNDNYILYLDMHSTLPFVMKVTDDEDSEQRFNILYELGSIKNNDAYEGMGTYEFEIQEIKPDSFAIFDKGAKKTYAIQYTIEEQGQLSFTLQ